MSGSSVFLVTDIGPKSKNLSKVLDINEESQALMVKEPEELTLLKEFPLKCISLEELSNEKGFKLTFSGIKQPPLMIEFSSPGERSMFSAKMAEVLSRLEKLVSQRAHLQTVFKVLKVNVRGAEQERLLGLDIEGKKILNFTLDNKLNKSIKIDSIKEMVPLEKSKLLIHFKKMHDYELYFESAAERGAFQEKVLALLGGDEVPHTEDEVEKSKDADNEKATRPPLDTKSPSELKDGRDDSKKSKMKSSIFQVTKINRRGKKQQRIILLDPKSDVMRNMDLNNAVKKEFNISDISTVVPEGEKELSVQFTPKVFPF